MGATVNSARMACAVAFRRSEDQLEFCLVTIPGSSNWEFPKTLVLDHESPHERACLEAERCARLRARLFDGQPLGQIESSRARERLQVTAFLFEVIEELPDVDAESVRRKWCLPEEARVRLRRKPLRRMIDLALERVRTRRD